MKGARCMGTLDTICLIDDSRKIFFPQEFMRMLGWDVGDSIKLTVYEKDGIAMLNLSEKRAGPRCIFCGADELKVKMNNYDVCKDCLEKIKAM